MTTACVFNNKLRYKTQVFLKITIFIFGNRLYPINFNFTLCFLTSSTLTSLMKMNYHYPHYPITFERQFLNTQLQFLNHQTENVSTNFSWIQRFGFVLCGAIAGWSKAAQTQHASCPQLHRDVRKQYPTDDNNIIHCIAWAKNRYNRL